MSLPSVSHRPERESLPSRRLNILLVDDDPADLALYVKRLEKEGCNVVACDSHLTALACLESLSLDGVVVHQGRDRFAWRAVVDRAAARPLQRTPVLVLTDHRDMVCQFEAMQLGAVEYVEKPVSGERMVRAFEGSSDRLALLPRHGPERRPDRASAPPGSRLGRTQAGEEPDRTGSQPIASE
ncbi:MAG TPA: response regulator [Terriglobia bacterium]|nr:response regulator [Terriglobia bacterium]